MHVFLTAVGFRPYPTPFADERHWNPVNIGIVVGAMSAVIRIAQIASYQWINSPRNERLLLAMAAMLAGNFPHIGPSPTSSASGRPHKVSGGRLQFRYNPLFDDLTLVDTRELLVLSIGRLAGLVPGT